MPADMAGRWECLCARTLAAVQNSFLVPFKLCQGPSNETVIDRFKDGFGTFRFEVTDRGSTFLQYNSNCDAQVRGLKIE